MVAGVSMDSVSVGSAIFVPTPWLVISCLALSAAGFLLALRGRSLRESLVALSVAAGAAALLLPESLTAPLFSLCAVVGLMSALVGSLPRELELDSLALRYAALVFALGTLLVLYRLGADSGPVFLWEHENIHGLSVLSNADEPFSKRLIEYLRWGDAPLAGGHSSALFGLPALLLTTNVAASLWSIRIVSAIAFLGAATLLFCFMRRSFGSLSATLAVALLLLNEVAFSYGRYAGASSASLLALMAALTLCARLVRGGGFVCALAAAAALYASTLGYAAARIPVVALAGATLVGILFFSSRPAARRALLAGTFAAGLGAVVAWQASMGSLPALFQARSEQFFYMVTMGGFPAELEQTEVAPLLSNRNPSTLERAQLAWALARVVTSKQLARGVSTWSAEADDVPVGGPFVDRPLGMALMSSLAMPFLFLGLFHSFRSLPLWPSFAVLCWFGLNTAALLLTNRIDVHRQFFLMVPLIIWTAVGAREWLCALRRSNALLGAGAALMAALLPLTLAPKWVAALNYSSGEESRVQKVREFLNQTAGRLFVIAEVPPGEESRLRIGLMERLRATGQKGEVGDTGFRNGLADGSFSADYPMLARLRAALASGETVVVLPAERYSQLTSALTASGGSASETLVGDVRVTVIAKRPQ